MPGAFAQNAFPETQGLVAFAQPGQRLAQPFAPEAQGRFGRGRSITLRRIGVTSLHKGQIRLRRSAQRKKRIRKGGEHRGQPVVPAKTKSQRRDLREPAHEAVTVYAVLQPPLEAVHIPLAAQGVQSSQIAVRKRRAGVRQTPGKDARLPVEASGGLVQFAELLQGGRVKGEGFPRRRIESAP